MHVLSRDLWKVEPITGSEPLVRRFSDSVWNPLLAVAPVEQPLTRPRASEISVMGTNVVYTLGSAPRCWPPFPPAAFETHYRKRQLCSSAVRSSVLRRSATARGSK